MSDLTQKKNEFDELCKELLAWKAILALIFQTCVEEVQTMSIQEIIDCIEGTPEIGTASLFENRVKISGTGTEDIGFAGEEPIYYDIRVDLRIPQSGKKVVEILIDLEPQTNRDPGYPLICRGIYYVGRMISQQYGTVFHKSHYEKLEKAYSIWICLRPHANERNSITRYRLTEDLLVGQSTLPKELYDKLAVVMVYLGDFTSADNKMLKLLDGLVGPGKKHEDTAVWLHDEFGLKFDNEELEEVDKVQGFADMFQQDGWEEGVDYRTAEILRVISEESHDGVTDTDTLMAKIEALPKSRPPRREIPDQEKTDREHAVSRQE